MPAILGRPYREIIPLDIQSGEMIQLHHAAKKVDDENNAVMYSHIIYPSDGGSGMKVIWQKGFVTGMRRKVNPVVHEFLVEKAGLNYFAEPRLALPLYLEMRRALPEGSFSVADLEKSLAVLMRKGGPLKKVKIDTQLHYV